MGLFRTEFCFLDHEEAPGIEEQVQAYRKVFAAFPGKKVVIRTLDAGADKPLAFVTAVDEVNPALGIRGYRTAWRRPELLDTQLQAIATAAADPLLAGILVGLGVTSLSMSPRALGGVAELLNSVTLQQCRDAAASVVAASSSTMARAAAAELLAPALIA